MQATKNNRLSILNTLGFALAASMSAPNVLISKDNVLPNMQSIKYPKNRFRNKQKGPTGWRFAKSYAQKYNSIKSSKPSKFQGFRKVRVMENGISVWRKP